MANYANLKSETDMIEYQIHSLEDKLNENLKKFLYTLPYVTADKVGLDSRAGTVFVGDDFLAIRSAKKRDFESFSFLGVKEECILSKGNYIIYLDDERGRIKNRINFYKKSKEKNDEG